jgi:hypothetical protein
LTILTVGSKAVRAAIANPVDSLKDEWGDFGCLISDLEKQERSDLRHKI